MISPQIMHFQCCTKNWKLLSRKSMAHFFAYFIANWLIWLHVRSFSISFIKLQCTNLKSEFGTNCYNLELINTCFSLSIVRSTCNVLSKKSRPIFSFPDSTRLFLKLFLLQKFPRNHSIITFDYVIYIHFSILRLDLICLCRFVWEFLLCKCLFLFYHKAEI